MSINRITRIVIKKGLLLPKCVAQQKFDNHVIRTAASDCWIWQGHITSYGYGNIEINHIPVLAHRLSYRLHKGTLKRNRVVMHLCDIPACVNPDHLKLGTQAENLLDMRQKGRASKPPIRKTRFKTEDLNKIRELYMAGKPQHKIAKQYNVTQSTIWRIIHYLHPYTDITTQTTETTRVSSDGAEKLK